MRRSRRIRLADVPRILALSAVQLAHLFGGRYRRTEGANCLVRDDHGRLLVVRPTYSGGHWMLPGGKVERSETPQHAAIRETREETGLTVEIERLVLVDAHRARDTSFVFVARAMGGSLEPQLGEIAEVGWLSREEIAAASPRLGRLLEHNDAAGGGVAYLGLPAGDDVHPA
jgi:ADP-ribose pyrophosphatase YjhB (NUDIX family)